jgi:hypothetical protein
VPRLPTTPGNDTSALALPAKVSQKPTVIDAELARVVEVWPALPEPIRRGILAIVKPLFLS